jgi:hypothetical protein
VSVRAVNLVLFSISLWLSYSLGCKAPQEKGWKHPLQLLAEVTMGVGLVLTFSTGAHCEAVEECLNRGLCTSEDSMCWRTREKDGFVVGAAYISSPNSRDPIAFFARATLCLQLP